MASKPPASVFNPQRLDALRFAQAGARLEGDPPLTGFARLAGDLHPPVDPSERVRWQARGEMRDGPTGGAPQAWLHLEARALVPLTCQRCLAPVQTPVEVDRWFRFVADEATAEALDDDSEEDLLALEPRPSLVELVEDELILSLPLVPLHERCPQPLSAADGPAGGEKAPGSERPHPFAALAKLKGRP
ncbi:DUF177 domain-containing protein [Hydrogenophaga sp. YM1]|uniref:YceD family protein n=1 Tax=Hydrogenophaga TaxID=47420 RepID=UPI0008783AC1|nr:MULTISPECIES: DUF177 domain-containing protein [unclassified Hydrogenophaga]MBN9369546.1 DUF177 domain-containing protein [Hydrogenophaga sp.]OJV38320.1 MAG: hypothetical protein BGO22_14465 [Hydrogenophaga sp. 70-12]QRR33139.1 DUF177 domain-containing protein [Hydrogenophaga sp. YM1]